MIHQHTDFSGRVALRMSTAGSVEDRLCSLSDGSRHSLCYLFQLLGQKQPGLIV